MPLLQRRHILPFILLKPVVGNPLNIQDGAICLHMVATTLIPKCLCVGRSKEIAAECFLNVLTLRVSPQNATNADKSFEALLSHTIGELSKSDSIYRANPEETSMVSQSPDATPHLFSLALGESRVRLRNGAQDSRLGWWWRRRDTSRGLSASCRASYWSAVLVVSSAADLQCVVPAVHRVQPAAVLPALPPPLLPAAAPPVRRRPHRLPGALSRVTSPLQSQVFVFFMKLLCSHLN